MTKIEKQNFEIAQKQLLKRDAKDTMNKRLTALLVIFLFSAIFLMSQNVRLTESEAYKATVITAQATTAYKGLFVAHSLQGRELARTKGQLLTLTTKARKLLMR